METYRPFIDLLRKRMVFDQFSSNDLISELDKKLSCIGTPGERIKLLNEVLKLKKVTTINVTYIGTIQYFFDYVQYKLEDEENTNKVRTDWEWLFNNLKEEYIQDTSLYDFNEVMHYKRLPNMKGKIKWFGKKSEALYFMDKFGFTMSQFNGCFVHKDGKKFSANNRLKTNPDPYFIERITKPKHK